MIELTGKKVDGKLVFEPESQVKKDKWTDSLKEGVEFVCILKRRTAPKAKYSADFDDFWLRFKGRWDSDNGIYHKGSKFGAYQAWKPLSESEKAAAYEAAPNAHGKYLPDCERWLKKKMWEK